METSETTALDVMDFSRVISDRKSYVARTKSPVDIINGTEKTYI